MADNNWLLQLPNKIIFYKGFIKHTVFCIDYISLYIIGSLYHRHSRIVSTSFCALYNVIHFAQSSAKGALASFVGAVESLGCVYPVV